MALFVGSVELDFGKGLSARRDSDVNVAEIPANCCGTGSFTNLRFGIFLKSIL